MNSSGWMRGMMAKSYSEEDLLVFVSQIIAEQLQEWELAYEVKLLENKLKPRNYVFDLRKEQQAYQVILTKDEISTLKNKGPYRLDRKIWTELQEQGLEIIKGYGNYIDNVFL